MSPGNRPSSSRSIRLVRLLRQASTRPSSDVVEKLRSAIGRAEAVIHETGGSSRLQKQLKKIRKRVVDLRDIDRQLKIVTALSRDRRADTMAVSAALQAAREKQSRKLKKVLEDELDAGLVKRLEKALSGVAWHAGSSTLDLVQIAGEFHGLVGRQSLTSETLSTLRAEIKKLRYRAELAAGPDRRNGLVLELSKVLDAIADWRDGLKLSETAINVLGDSKRNTLLSVLRAQNQSRFLEAARSVEHARQKVPMLFSGEAEKKQPASSQYPEYKIHVVSA